MNRQFYFTFIGLICALVGFSGAENAHASKDVRPTLLIYDSFSAHHDRQGQLEGAWRLDALKPVIRKFDQKKPNYQVQDYSRSATVDEKAIFAVHASSYIEKLKHPSSDHDYLCAGRWCPYLSKDSYQVAARASSMVLQAVRLVHTRQVANAFALTRPPGHHATRASGDGYCLLNHVAIAAQNLVTQLGYNRVAIVDLDTHHGNGTESIVRGNPKIRYLSVHQHPAWPFTGDRQDGLFNFPIEPGTSSQIALERAKDKMISVLNEFKPDFILVSAGYDLHWRDPNGALVFTSRDIATLHKSFIDYANTKVGGRIVFVLEGGYNKEALQDGVENTLAALQGTSKIQDRNGKPELN